MEHKVKKAKFISLLYFITLGIVNLGASLVNGQLIALDPIIVALAITPLILTTRVVFLSLGILGSFISLYIGVACFIFNFQQGSTTPQLSFMMGYLLAISSFAASSLLIYSGLNSTKTAGLQN